MSDKGYARLFWMLVFGLFFYRLLYIWLAPFDLAPDEAYYWDWSRNLDLGYYSKPPLVAWVIALCTAIGGNHPFFVRLGTVLFSLGSGIVIYLLGRGLFNNRVGFWAFALANATPGSAVGSVIMSIDPPLLFFWGLTVYLLYQALFEQKTTRWYLAGVTLGLGLLSKYTMIAVIPSLFLFLFSSAQLRHWVRSKEPYLCASIGLAFLLPNLYWIYSKHWITFVHTAGLVENKGPNLLTFIWFFGPQVGILSPPTFLLVLYGFWQGGRLGICQQDDRYLYLFWTSVPLLGFFTIMSLFSVCYVNWAAPAYFSAVVLAVAVVLEQSWRAKTKRWILATTLAVGVFATLFTYQMDLVWSRGLSTKIPARRVPTNRLKGWQELGKEVTTLLATLDRTKTFLISDKRQIASELAFYVEGHPTVYTLNLTGYTKSQYDLWEGYTHKVGFNALYITKLGRRPPKKFIKTFDKVAETKQVKIYSSEQFVRGYSVYLCERFHGLQTDRQSFPHPPS